MGERIMLVEGKDDQHVMWNLFEARGVSETFRVECPQSEPDEDEGGGIQRLVASIPAWLDQSELERLAVTVDANDKGPQARWSAIRDRLVSSGLQDVPTVLRESGIAELTLLPRTPRSVLFALWVMPDNQSPGMLEDFVAGMIHEDDEMLPRVDGFLDSIEPDKRRFSPPHLPKARIHSWLAVSERPGRPMGQAIKADGHLDANSPSLEPFLDWVNRALVD